MNKNLGTLSRVLLALIFLGLVFGKLMMITNTPNGYLIYQQSLGQQFGLPGIFAPLLILIQLAGGFALLFGYKTRFFAFFMAGFSVFLAIILGKVILDVMFLYLGIAGGLIALGNNPGTAFALDNLKK
jgi:putative oxidoreductase